MPYEADSEVLAWFDCALAHENPSVRRRALELLQRVECEPRRDWLTRALKDPEPDVVATAALVQASCRLDEEYACLELMESDFADGLGRDDLRWEWEYTLKVCDGYWVPETVRLVWTTQEDDVLAKELAVQKARFGDDGTKKWTPIVVRKRLVNQYTRSARSVMEAMLWHQKGRPRYSDGRDTA